MAWFNESSQESKWIFLAQIIDEKYGRFGVVNNYQSMTKNAAFSYTQVDTVLAKMLEYIDDKSLVTFEEIESDGEYGEVIFGGPVNISTRYIFYILEDEISKITIPNEPIHITCRADEFPEKKEEFIELIRGIVNS